MNIEAVILRLLRDPVLFIYPDIRPRSKRGVTG